MYEIKDNIYCYPNTSVLINKFNIKDKRKLEAIERDLTSLRIKELVKNPIEGNFDLIHLRNIHKYIFQDIYNWAGELRTIRVTKGFTTFAYPENIESEANKCFDKLKSEDYLKNLSIDMFCKKLAYYKAELNILHPFRDGNGRAIREFVRCLALNSGYYIRFPLDKQIYINAMILSPYDTKPLEEFFRNNTVELEGISKKS